MSVIVKKIKDSGFLDVNCIVAVFVSEGYPLTLQSKFDSDCQSRLAAFANDKTFAKKSYSLNAYSIFIPSVDAGISHPQLWPTSACNDIDHIPKMALNTAFGFSFDMAGLHYVTAPPNLDYTPIAKAIAAAIPTSLLTTLPYRLKDNYLPIIQINTPYNGGFCSGSYATSTMGPKGAHIMLHEASHAFGNSDEYPTGTNMEGHNITNIKTPGNLPVRWKNIYNGYVPKNNPDNGWQIPTHICKMGQDVTQDFCAVCENQILTGWDFLIKGSGGTPPSAPINPVPPVTPTTPSKLDLTLFPQFKIPPTQKIPPNIADFPNPNNYQFYLQWTAIQGCPNYIIQWSSDNGSTWQSSMANTGTSSSITHLTGKTKYQIRMCCDYYNNVHGAFSPAQTITTL